METHFRPSELSAYLSVLRKEKGPGWLIERMGVSRATMYRMCKGEPASTDVLERLGIKLVACK